MKGRYLTVREQAFILSNATRYHYGYVARLLGEKYPEDNGGTRSRYAVLSYMKKVDK
jgi:hypothetical protein